MKYMPYEIKQKLRQYANAQTKIRNLALQIDGMIESYGVPLDNLMALADIYSDEPQKRRGDILNMHNPLLFFSFDTHKCSPK